MRVRVKAHPKSGREEVRGKGGEGFEVWVREAPEGGKANEAVLRALAGHFGVSRSRLSLVSGYASRNKWVEILK